MEALRTQNDKSNHKINLIKGHEKHYKNKHANKLVLEYWQVKLITIIPPQNISYTYIYL